MPIGLMADDKQGQNSAASGPHGEATEDFENVPEKSWRTCVSLAEAHHLHRDDETVERWMSQAFQTERNSWY
jgi:hypothetical protein